MNSPKVTAVSMRRALVLLIVIMHLVKLPALWQEHAEADEKIYLSLAVNLVATGHYTLRGTPILKRIEQAAYDKPLFHHPPLFMILIAPLACSSNFKNAVIVSWLGHLLALLAIYMLLKKLLGERHWQAQLFALAMLAADPMLFFVSQRIWTDSLLVGLVTMSIALFIMADGEEGPAVERRRLALSGMFLGLAIVTKIPAVTMGPVYLAAHLRRHRWNDWRAWGALAAWFAPPCVLIAVPWFIKFYMVYGMFSPKWLNYDTWKDTKNLYIHWVQNRPAYYFFKELFLISPGVFVPLAVMAWLTARSWNGRNGRHERNGLSGMSGMSGKEELVPSVPLVPLVPSPRPDTRSTSSMAWLVAFWFLWAISFYTIHTWVGRLYYEMRYVVMATPPCYVLVALVLKDLKFMRRPAVLIAALALLFFQAMTTGYMLHPPHLADLLSMFSELPK